MKRCTVDTFVGLDGSSVWLGVGDEYPDDHPLVKAFPGNFADVPKPVGRPLGSKNRPKSDEL